MRLIERVISEEVLDQAYSWLCNRSRDYHHNNDVWQLRRWWTEKKPMLVVQLRAEIYRFQEQRCVRGLGEVKENWSAQDTLVLKALVIVLHEMMQPHPV